MNPHKPESLDPITKQPRRIPWGRWALYAGGVFVVLHATVGLALRSHDDRIAGFAPGVCLKIRSSAALVGFFCVFSEFLLRFFAFFAAFPTEFALARAEQLR